MRYVGGKSKIAKSLSEVILDRAQSRKFYLEPFVGGGSVFPQLAPHFEWSVAGDKHLDLVLMWNAVIQDGWVPPMQVSEDDYALLKTAEPSALRGFVGMGGSFGGKWFGGYARGGFNSDGSPRNHQAESARAVLKIQETLTRVNVGQFRNWSYGQWNPVPGTVVYCDPPYASTQGYSTGGFPHEEFWETVRRWSRSGCEVFVSEYSAPADFESIWSKGKRMTLTQPKQGRPVNTENLFIFKGDK